MRIRTQFGGDVIVSEFGGELSVGAEGDKDAASHKLHQLQRNK